MTHDISHSGIIQLEYRTSDTKRALFKFQPPGTGGLEVGGCLSGGRRGEGGGLCNEGI